MAKLKSKQGKPAPNTSTKQKDKNSPLNKKNSSKGEQKINNNTKFKPKVKQNFNSKKVKENLVKSLNNEKNNAENVNFKKKPIISKVPDKQKDKVNGEQATNQKKKPNLKNKNKLNLKAEKNAKKNVNKLESPKTGDQSTEENEKNNLLLTTRASTFDENKFNEIVNLKNAKKVANELKKLITEESQKLKKQVFSDYKYLLNISYFRIPKCPKRMVKLNLKHSLISEDDDVVFFVKDLHRGSQVDFEPTIQHYEDMLREKGVTGIKKIIPLAQLKKEYGSFEAKIKLSNLFEHYLCDGAIVGHVVGFLGKKFLKTRSTLHAVRMNALDLAKEISKAKQKTCYRQGEKGALISIPVGSHTMSPEMVADNIMAIIPQLKILLPGGLPNIRNMYLRVNIPGTSSLPIYVSVKKPPSDIPNIIGPKEKKLRKLASEANKLLTKFHMSDDGKLVPLPASEIIERKRKQSEQISHSEAKKTKKQNENLKKVVDKKNTDAKIKKNDKNENKKKKKQEEDETDESDTGFILPEAEEDSDEDESDEENAVLKSDDDEEEDSDEDDNDEDNAGLESDEDEVEKVEGNDEDEDDDDDDDDDDESDE